MKTISTTSSAGSRLWTDRDFKMVYAAMECGALTAQQFSWLFFRPASVKGQPAVHSNCQLRLKLLKQHGLLKRIKHYQLLQEGKRPYLYAATRQGARLVAQWLECDLHDLPYREKDERVSSTGARHLIAENDFRVAVLCAVRDTPEIKLIHWLDGVTLKSTHSADKMKIQGPDGGSQTAVVVPDDYFVLRLLEPKAQVFHHFVEIDLGNETGETSNRDEWRKTWARKIRSYIKYLEGGEKSLFYQRYGALNARVLTVTTSEQRMQHLLAVTERAGGQKRFWFTTSTQIAAHMREPQTLLTAPIWRIATLTKDTAIPLFGTN